MASKAIGFLTFKFGADLKGFTKGLNKAQRHLTKFGKNAQRTGKNLTRSLTLPIAALGGVAVKTFMDFEQAMLKVKAISGATEKEMVKLTASAKELGSSTMFTAAQVSELQLNLSKLGLNPQQILDSTEAILQLSQATDSDLGEAATTAASVMNAFGLEATDMTRIADVMADSFSSTALDLQKFQTAMASVAPVAKVAGADLEQTTAILGLLVNNGVDASSAGTALRNIFLDLSKEGMSWNEAMTLIQNSLNPLETAMDLFGKRGAAVATIIANNSTELQTLTADFRDSEGEAKNMADIMDSGVAGAFRRLKSQLEGAAIELGEKLVPIFEKFGKFLQKLIKWFTDLNSAQQESIVTILAIAAAIGPLLFLFGGLFKAIGTTVKFLAAFRLMVIKATSVTAFFNLVLAANPITIIILALTAVVGAIWYFATSTSKVAVIVRNVFKTMANGVIWILNGLIDTFNFVSGSLGGPTIARIEKYTMETYNAADATEELKEQASELEEELTAVQKVEQAVNEATSDQIAQVYALVQVLRDETTSLEDQKTALEELQRIAPGFFEDYEIGISTMDDLTTATDKFTESLIRNAKVAAVKDQMEPILKQLADYEMRMAQAKKAWKQYVNAVNSGEIEYGAAGLEAAEKRWPTYGGYMAMYGESHDTQGGFHMSGGSRLKETDWVNMIADGLDVPVVTGNVIIDQMLASLGHQAEDFKKQLEEIGSLLPDMGIGEIFASNIKSSKKSDKSKTTGTGKSDFELSKEELERWHKVSLNMEKENYLNGLITKEEFDRRVEAEEIGHLEQMKMIYESYGEDLSEIDAQILDAKIQKMEEELELTKRMTDAQKLLNAGVMMFGDILETSLNSAIDSQENFFQVFLKNIKKAIRQLLIQLAIMTLIQAIMGKGSAAFHIANLKTNLASIMNVKLAKGGLVTGPTTALVGEQSTGSNPEVVAPLDKLKSMMGNNTVTVEGRLIGNDIYLSNEKTKFNRNRTV